MTIPSCVLVHDWLEVYSGAERVADEIIGVMQPECAFGFIVNEDVLRRFRNRVEWLDVPAPIARLMKKRYRAMMVLLAMAYERLDLREYDLVVSSSHAVAKGIRVGPEQLHISYIHSPMRYAWDLQEEYLAAAGMRNSMRAWIARGLLHYLRLWDVRTANGVDHFIANSKYIARRVWRTYRRYAAVIYPPVDLDMIPFCDRRGKRYITVGRLVPYKRVDALIEAFKLLPGRQLVVVGDGPMRRSLEAKAPENVVFEGRCSDERLRELLSQARAFVYAAEEDFGIAMVEAQAAGVPVIAYGRGGAAEIVRPLGIAKHPTGIVFKSRDPCVIAAAIEEFECREREFSAEACRENALRFDSSVFRKRFRAFVEEKWEEHQKALREGRLPWEREEARVSEARCSALDELG